jgi:hypothetical protein
MSYSVWSTHEALMQIQEEVSLMPEFANGSALILEEGVDEHNSEHIPSAVQRNRGA